MSCFNIPLESALYKLQNAGKKSNIWKPLEIYYEGNSRNTKNGAYFAQKK
jgi:hypothetical protein